MNEIQRKNINKFSSLTSEGFHEAKQSHEGTPNKARP